MSVTTENKEPTIKIPQKDRESDRDTISSRLKLARAYRDREQYDKAVEELKIILKDNPRNGRIYHELGWVHHEMGDYNLAIRELKQAIKFGKNDNDVYLGLARTYRDREEYGKAIKQLNIALKRSPSDGNINYRQGWIYREAVKYRLSVKAFKRAGKLYPYNNEPFLKNMIHNEIEISQKKAVLKSKPMVLGVTLTHRCNIRCRMCDVWKKPWDIPKEIAQEVMEHLPYLRYVYWLGGEPFLYEYFEELFDKAAIYPNLCQVIVTNGLLINKKWAKKIAESNSHIIYSIDGVSKEVYEYIREGAKFEDLIESINLVNRYRPKTNGRPLGRMVMIMQAAIMKSNYRQLADFLEFSREYNFDRLNLIPIRYKDSEENIFMYKDRDAASFIEAAGKEILDRSRTYGIKLFNQLPRIENYMPSRKNTASKTLLCHWPWKSLYMLYQGAVKPYGFCEEEVGNITQSSIREIWNNSAMQSYRKRLISRGHTGWCSHRCVSGIIPRQNLRLEAET